MRQLGKDYAQHIDQQFTHLCTCWRLTRRDGTVFGFCDHDEVVHFDGTDFEPHTGLDGAALSASLGGAVDTSEISGGVRSDKITAQDLLMGRYDGAKVETFSVNWKSPQMRLRVRVDSLGNITQQGVFFKAELRGPEAAMNVPKGRLFEHGCNARLGDSNCGVNLFDTAYKGVGTVMAVLDDHRLDVTGLDVFGKGWFAYGKLVWKSGSRQGMAQDIDAHERLQAIDRITLRQALIGDINVGDAFDAFAGCDKYFSTCQQKFANQINFRGFPHMTGNDFVIGYPVPGATGYDGAARDTQG